jgi:DNA repair protein RadC
MHRYDDQGSPLYEIDPEGCCVFVRKATRKEILALASDILETRMRRSKTLLNPNEAKLYLSLQLGDLEREVFCWLFLDDRHRVIAFEKLFLGTIDATSFTREKWSKPHSSAALPP